MKPISGISLSFFLLLAMGGFSQQEPPLERSYPAWLRFDQGYISAWTLAHHGETIKAKQAILSLNVHWQQAAPLYAASLAPTRANQETLQHVGILLADACQALDNNFPATACRLMESAQRSLCKLRTGNGLTYFFDPWYALEEQLSALKYTLSDPLLHLEEWETIAEQASWCATQWKELACGPANPALFGWNTSQLDRFRQQALITSRQLEVLLHAIDSADVTEETAQAAAQAHKAFINNLALFGALSAPKPFIAASSGQAAEPKIQVL